MKTITHKKRTHKILASDKQALETLMSQGGVGLISQLTTGTGTRTRALGFNPFFIKMVHNHPVLLKYQPKYMQEYAKKHPRAQCFVKVLPSGRKVYRQLTNNG